MSDTKEKINIRFVELIDRGESLINDIPEFKNGRKWHSVPNPKIPIYEGWLYSSYNLIQEIVPKGSQYYDQTVRLLNAEGMSGCISTIVIQKMLGLLNSAKEEWDNELFEQIEYIFAAETFDDFLYHATKYHKANRKMESSILASAVLEDIMKKIAKKNSIEPKGKSIEPLIDELVKARVFTKVKARRIKAYAGTRNHAFHAEWNDFDLKDVGEMINGIRELIENYL